MVGCRARCESLRVLMAMSGMAIDIATRAQVAAPPDGAGQPSEIVVEAPEPECETIEAGVYATTLLTALVRGRAVMQMKLTIAVMQAKHSYQPV